MSLPPEAQTVEIELNGSGVSIPVAPGELLIESLRERMDCTSVRGSCGIGICGTCTVQVDGRAVSACLMLTEQARDRVVTTSEGLCADGELDEIQQAFVDHEAYQCSFCIPGMVMALRALKDERPDADAETARDVLGGNLCRCGTYPWILDAVDDVFPASQSPLQGEQ